MPLTAEMPVATAPIMRVPAARVLTPGPGRLYQAVRTFSRFAFACTMRVRSSGLEHLQRNGGCLLAVCHVSHLDPIFVSVMSRRPVSWMARQEFYQSPLSAWFLRNNGAFSVNRQGPVLASMREAMGRLSRGEMVGIFPEGEIMTGEASVVRGGRIKRGIVLLAARSGCPVVPVIVAGTDKLNRPGPWLPARRGRLWIRAGEALTAEPADRTRAGREHFALRLELEMRRLFAEMRTEYGLPESIIP